MSAAQTESVQENTPETVVTENTTDTTSVIEAEEEAESGGPEISVEVEVNAADELVGVEDGHEPQDVVAETVTEEPVQVNEKRPAPIADEAAGGEISESKERSAAVITDELVEDKERARQETDEEDPIPHWAQEIAHEADAGEPVAIVDESSLDEKVKVAPAKAKKTPAKKSSGVKASAKRTPAKTTRTSNKQPAEDKAPVETDEPTAKKAAAKKAAPKTTPVGKKKSATKKTIKTSNSVKATAKKAVTEKTAGENVKTKTAKAKTTSKSSNATEAVAAQKKLDSSKNKPAKRAKLREASKTKTPKPAPANQKAVSASAKVEKGKGSSQQKKVGDGSGSVKLGALGKKLTEAGWEPKLARLGEYVTDQWSQAAKDSGAKAPKWTTTELSKLVESERSINQYITRLAKDLGKEANYTRHIEDSGTLLFKANGAPLARVDSSFKVHMLLTPATARLML
jgi:hypothetical protein